MSKKEKPAASDEPKPAVANYCVAATPERGIWRAGRHWPREGAEVARSDFTDEQWAAIEGEPRLVVSAL